MGFVENRFPSEDATEFYSDFVSPKGNTEYKS